MEQAAINRLVDFKNSNRIDAARDIRAEMEGQFQQSKADGYVPLNWYMTEEARDELAEALGYEDGDKPSEALGLRITISPGVAEIGGWGLNCTR